MEIKEQSGLRAVLENTPLPKVCRVRQIFQRDGIQDVPPSCGKSWTGRT